MMKVSGADEAWWGSGKARFFVALAAPWAPTESGKSHSEHSQCASILAGSRMHRWPLAQSWWHI